MILAIVLISLLILVAVSWLWTIPVRKDSLGFLEEIEKVHIEAYNANSQAEVDEIFEKVNKLIERSWHYSQRQRIDLIEKTLKSKKIC